MGIDTVIWVDNRLEILDCHRKYCFVSDKFWWRLLYEVNNIDDAEAVSLILDPKHLFKPIKSFEYHEKEDFGYLRLVMVDIPFYHRLTGDSGLHEKIILMKGRSIECPVPGCWWGWVNDFIYIRREYTVFEKHNIMRVTVDHINYMNTSIALDYEYSIYGKKWYYIVEPVYNVSIQSDERDHWILNYIHPLLKFLKTKYPVYIRLRSRGKN
ncbi:hypothetical protein J7L13_01675 [bacterium]|nr:hypothetical protein [bacterium]